MICCCYCSTTQIIIKCLLYCKHMVFDCDRDIWWRLWWIILIRTFVREQALTVVCVCLGLNWSMSQVRRPTIIHWTNTYQFGFCLLERKCRCNSRWQVSWPHTLLHCLVQRLSTLDYLFRNRRLCTFNDHRNNCRI